MKKQCTNCGGSGRITAMEPKKWGSGKSLVILWNHLIPINYTCSSCKGTGKTEHQPAGAE